MSRRKVAAGPVNEKGVEALTVAMALAPGVYARNRMFELFTSPAVQRARCRAAILRGIVAQVARARGVSLATEGHTAAGDPSYVLRYEVPALRMSRVVGLTATELAALRLLLSRANVHALPPDSADRARVDAALARLLGEAAGEGAAAAAREALSPGG